MSRPAPAPAAANPNACLLSAVWNRNRLVVQAPTPAEANALAFHLRIFIPRYRQLLLCGDIPKEASFLSGARLLRGDDPEALREAVLQSFEEEEIGSPPIQVIYFQPPAAIVSGVLAGLDRGWIATTCLARAELQKAGLTLHRALELGRSAIFIVDPATESSKLEDMIFEQTRDSSREVQQYVIQMNQSQVYLAFQAIRDELQTRDSVTSAAILEEYGIRQRTLDKILTVGRRDHRLDLAPYIRDTPPDVLKFLKEVGRVKTVDLAAVFEGETPVGYAKFREVVFPSRYFLDIVAMASLARETSGAFRSFEAGLETHHLLIYQGDYLYAFLVDIQENPFRFRIEIERMLAGHGLKIR